MANIKSQKKRNLTNEINRQRNIAVRSRVRSYVREAEQALSGGDASQIGDAVQQAVHEIDVAERKGVLHSKSAARKKSSLHRRATAAAK